MEKFFFSLLVIYVYNFFVYVVRGHRRYVRRFGDSAKKVVFFGMNFGFYGMI